MRDWWDALLSILTKEIHTVGTLLCDFVPHAAALERGFSNMGNFQTGKLVSQTVGLVSCRGSTTHCHLANDKTVHAATRNRLTVETTCDLAMIKTHYQKEVPR